MTPQEAAAALGPLTDEQVARVVQLLRPEADGEQR